MNATTTTDGVTAWWCPECERIVGVANVGAAAVSLCSACREKRDGARRVNLWVTDAGRLALAVLGHRIAGDGG